jgi:hypothetical protein
MLISFWVLNNFFFGLNAYSHEFDDESDDE